MTIAWIILPSFLLSWLANFFLMKRMPHFGVRNSGAENGERWNKDVRPATGGIAMGIVLAVALAGSLLYYESLPPWILLAFASAFLTGYLDDSFNIPPLAKVLGQVITAIAFSLGGAILSVTGNEFLDVSFTILFVVWTLNSFNMLDNMDGIAGLAAFGCILSYIMSTSALPPEEEFVVLVSMGMVGGFLALNLFPSQLFMGDTGSHLLGAMLCWIYMKHVPGDIVDFGILTYAFFFLPFTDSMLVILSRLIRGKSPFTGGKDHLTHRINMAGLSAYWLPWILAGLNFIIASLSLNDSYHWLLLPVVIIVALILAALYCYTYYREARGN